MSIPYAYLTPAEIEKVLAVAKKTGPREHAIVLLGYKHGLRVSEVVKLRFTDILGDKLIVRRLKGSLRTIQPLASHTNTLLDEPTVLATWLQARGTGGDRIFTSKKSPSISRQQVFNIFRALATEAGIEPGRRHFHILKHSLACNILGVGTEQSFQPGDKILAYVQQILGHADPKNTLRYLHISDSAAGAVSTQRLNALFTGGAA